MSKVIRLPTGENVEFPDSMSNDQIAAVISGTQEKPSRPGLERAIFGNPAYTPEPSPAMETALHLGTGMAAFPFALASGVGGMALPGESGQGRRRMMETQEALTYQPRGEAGKALSRVVTAPLRWLGKGAEAAGQKVADVTESPIAGALTEATIQMAPALIGGALQTSAARAREIKAAELKASEVKNETIAKARKEGFVMPSPSLSGRALSSIGGKQALKQEMNLKNQAVADQIARREAGLPPDVPITVDTLRAARQAAEQPYRDVASLSPSAASALQELQVARTQKQQWYQYYNTGPKNPRILQKAKKFESEEKFWDKFIEQEAVKANRGELVKQLKEARVAIAKNYAVQRAHNPGTGSVDPQVIGRIYAKQKGEGITGGLETIGRFATGPGREVMRDMSRVGVPGGQHGVAIESAAGGALGGLHGGVRGAILGAGIPLLRIPARQLAMTPLMQPPATMPGLGLSFAQMAQPGLLGMTTGLGMLPEELLR